MENAVASRLSSLHLHATRKQISEELTSETFSKRIDIDLVNPITMGYRHPDCLGTMKVFVSVVCHIDFDTFRQTNIS